MYKESIDAINRNPISLKKAKQTKQKSKRPEDRKFEFSDQMVQQRKQKKHQPKFSLGQIKTRLSLFDI